MFNKNKNCQAVLCDKFFYLSLPLLAPHQTVVHPHPCKRFIGIQLLPFFNLQQLRILKTFIHILLHIVWMEGKMAYVHVQVSLVEVHI